MGGKKWVCTTKLNAYRYIQFTISRWMLNTERFVEKGGGGRQWNVVQIVLVLGVQRIFPIGYHGRTVHSGAILLISNMLSETSKTNKSATFEE